MKRETITFEDEELWLALRAEAKREGRDVNALVLEAVDEWLQAREDEELRVDLEEARREWEQHGGVEVSEFIADLSSRRADGR